MQRIAGESLGNKKAADYVCRFFIEYISNQPIL